jgi:hypothetical protein
MLELRALLSGSVRLLSSLVKADKAIGSRARGLWRSLLLRCCLTTHSWSLCDCSRCGPSTPANRLVPLRLDMTKIRTAPGTNAEHRVGRELDRSDGLSSGNLYPGGGAIAITQLYRAHRSAPVVHRQLRQEDAARRGRCVVRDCHRRGRRAGLHAVAAQDLQPTIDEILGQITREAVITVARSTAVVCLSLDHWRDQPDCADRDQGHAGSLPGRQADAEPRARRRLQCASPRDSVSKVGHPRARAETRTRRSTAFGRSSPPRRTEPRLVLGDARPTRCITVASSRRAQLPQLSCHPVSVHAGPHALSHAAFA